MGSKTSIEWTNGGSTWNPIRARRDGKIGWHCRIVTPGCENCYAATINIRLGTGLNYRGIGPETFLDEKMLLAPLRWRKPRMIFVGSMTDLFGDWVTGEMLDRIFAVMALTPQHTYQTLTKRVERMRDYLSRHNLTEAWWEAGDRMADQLPDISGIPYLNADPDKTPFPLPNIWAGISIEDQRRADERIPALLQTPAAVRWVSCEPLIGPVNLVEYLHEGRRSGVSSSDQSTLLETSRLDWVVIGGESGPGARPFKIEWARSIIRQCKAAGVPVFIKQLGSLPIIEDAPPFGRDWPEGTHFGNRTGIRELNGRVALLKDRKGGDIAEFPEDLRVREYPPEARE